MDSISGIKVQKIGGIGVTAAIPSSFDESSSLHMNFRDVSSPRNQRRKGWMLHQNSPVSFCNDFVSYVRVHYFDGYFFLLLTKPFLMNFYIKLVQKVLIMMYYKYCITSLEIICEWNFFELENLGLALSGPNFGP